MDQTDGKILTRVWNGVRGLLSRSRPSCPLRALSPQVLLPAPLVHTRARARAAQITQL